MTQPNPLKTKILDPLPTHPNPTHGSTQPMDNSELTLASCYRVDDQSWLSPPSADAFFPPQRPPGCLCIHAFSTDSSYFISHTILVLVLSTVPHFVHFLLLSFSFIRHSCSISSSSSSSTAAAAVASSPGCLCISPSSSACCPSDCSACKTYLKYSWNKKCSSCHLEGQSQRRCQRRAWGQGRHSPRRKIWPQPINQ